MARRRRKIAGYVVIEFCDYYEQVLCLEMGHDNSPPEGVLDWPGEGQEHRTVFRSKASARQAIARTDHWAKAFGVENIMPERKNCKIVPVSIVED